MPVYVALMQGGDMKIRIVSAGAYVPARRVSNDELAQSVDTSDEWIRSHTGIGNRHICSEDQASSDLAVEAATSAIRSSGLSPDDIDMIIVATATPDYLGFPSTSCIVQDRLGINDCGAFDITAGCTGFVYALETGRALIPAGTAKHVLVIGVEVLSKIVDWKDRNTCVLFGDGAGAVILGATDDDDKSGFIDSILRSEGSGALSLIRKAGGSREPFDREKTEDKDIYLTMDGRKVYNFAVRVNAELITSILERNGLTFEDVDWVVPHQANIRIIQASARRLGIDLDKFFINIEEYANTSAASIPLALHQLAGTGRR